MNNQLSFRLFLFLYFFSFYCLSFSSGHFLLPFGTQIGDSYLRPETEDGNSVEVFLSVKVKFFSRDYGSVFVNENGLLSFLTDIPNFFNIQFPLEYPLIAAFYSDVDTRYSGRVWYRKTNEKEFLTLIQNKISNYFTKYTFEPLELFIVTWDNVGSYQGSKVKTNNFQIIIASDNQSSYVLLYYPTNGLQWITGMGKNAHVPDTLAQAGIISGDGRHILLPASGSDQIRHLDKWSNVNEEGLWIYHVGKLNPLEYGDSPMLFRESIYEEKSMRSCELGHTICHSQSICNDYNPGFCCSCKPHFIGNGRSCVPIESDIRIQGRVSGTVNSITIKDQDLHCYVVTNEGRTYTAISKIPRDLGQELQGLTALGSPVAWLFAKPENDDIENGFTLTGGVLNYTAEITFPDTGHFAKIKFIFRGLDASNNLEADVSLEGSLPPLGRLGTKIHIDDYEEEYNLNLRGQLFSRSTRTFKLETGSRKSMSYELNQKIEFNACKYDKQTSEKIYKVHSSRNFIIYDQNEEVSRYAMISHVKSFHHSQDPCSHITCGSRSSCIHRDGSFPECICETGFEMDEYSLKCEDINECNRENSCSEFAQCFNTLGSHFCKCIEGYFEDGVSCVEDNCSLCHPNADCVASNCKCKSGYSGNGQVCTLSTSEILLSGYSNPSSLTLDVSETSTINPVIDTIIKVVNHGPHTEASLALNISLHLSNKNNLPLFLLQEAPYVKLNDRNTVIPCTIDSRWIIDQKLQRSKRQKEYIDYYPGEDYVVSYDYSHFDEAKSVEEASEENLENESSLAFASVHCAYSLPPNEISEIHINARLIKDNFAQDYSSSSQIEFESFAQIISSNNSLTFPQGKSIKISSIILLKNGNLNLLPGQRLRCGDLDCHPHANCFHTFSAQREKSDCKCISGYIGNGVTSCSLSDSGDSDCLVTQNCHYNANCVRNQNDFHVCQCKKGYVGDGKRLCTKEKEEPCNLNCSPNADCFSNKGGDKSCVCRKGFRGDGYQCVAEKLNLKPPVCLFDVCICKKGHLINNTHCLPESSGGNFEIVARAHCTTSSPCSCPTGYTYNENRDICQFDKIILPKSNIPCQNHQVCSRDALCDASFCRCKDGWMGNGIDCMPLSLQEKQCSSSRDCRQTENCVINAFGSSLKSLCISKTIEDSSQENSLNHLKNCRKDSDCDVHAQCVYVYENKTYQCLCNPNYVQSKQGCVSSTPSYSCDVFYNCHSEHGVCRKENDRYECFCKTGYFGNGINCTRDLVIGCNIIDNCAKHASCVFDPVEKGYRCQCKTEKGFIGDGLTCQIDKPCSLIPNACDSNAKCLSNQCQCNDHYIGDGYICEEIPKYIGNYLILSQGMALIKIQFPNTVPGFPIYIQGNEMITGLDVDCLRGKIYWTDMVGKAIRRSNINGTQVEVFIADNLEFPVGIAVDWISRNIYWTDSGKQTIEIANIDTKIRKVLFDERLRKPRGIAVHPFMGRLVWTDWDNQKPKIESSNLDGTNRVTLLDTHLGMPNSLAMNFEKYEFCWTEGGSPSIQPSIDCMPLFGGERKSLVKLRDDDLPYGLTIHSQNVFWSDWKKPNVHGANMNTGIRIPSLSHVLSGMGKPFGLIAIPETCSIVPNLCQSSSSFQCAPNQICSTNPNQNGVSCI